MTVRLYLEEDTMRHALVRALRACGVDVTTALEGDMIAREDHEHVDHATAQGRVLHSFNVGDFYRLHRDYLAEGKRHAGMILARQQQYTVGDQMRRLLKLIAVRSAEEILNRVEFLSAWS